MKRSQPLVVRVRNWTWLPLLVVGAAELALDFYFWRYRPGAPAPELGFEHMIKLSTRIVFVSDREFLLHNLALGLGVICSVICVIAGVAARVVEGPHPDES